jgi:hypothetical protein
MPKITKQEMDGAESYNKNFSSPDRIPLNSVPESEFTDDGERISVV